MVLLDQSRQDLESMVPRTGQTEELSPECQEVRDDLRQRLDSLQQLMSQRDSIVDKHIMSSLPPEKVAEKFRKGGSSAKDQTMEVS